MNAEHPNTVAPVQHDRNAPFWSRPPGSGCVRDATGLESPPTPVSQCSGSWELPVEGVLLRTFW